MDVDEREGRRVLPPTSQAVYALNLVWDELVKANMHRGKDKPSVQCFEYMVEAGVRIKGYHRNGTVFVNTVIAPNTEGDINLSMVNDELLHVMIEEVAHYVTMANDLTRDFQTYAFLLSARLMRSLLGRAAA